MYSGIDVGTIRAFLPYQSWVNERGGNFESVLRRNGLKHQLSHESGTSWVPYNLFSRVLGDFGIEDKFKLDPLELADNDVSKIFDIEIEKFGKNENKGVLEALRVALETTAKRFAPCMAIWFDIKGGTLVIRFTVVAKRQISDFRTLVVYRCIMVLIKSVLGESWNPPYVDLDLSLSSSLSLGGSTHRINSIKGRNAIPLDIAVPAEDMKKYVDNMISSPARATSKIKGVIQMLGIEYANISVVSQIFGVSRRTLHRVLRDEGTTFKQLLLDIKMHQAKISLINGDAKTEISNMLGYTNTSNFLRAYRSYYNLPVGAFI